MCYNKFYYLCTQKLAFTLKHNQVNGVCTSIFNKQDSMHKLRLCNVVRSTYHNILEHDQPLSLSISFLLIGLNAPFLVLPQAH